MKHSSDGKCEKAHRSNHFIKRLLRHLQTLLLKSVSNNKRKKKRKTKQNREEKKNNNNDDDDMRIIENTGDYEMLDDHT